MTSQVSLKSLLLLAPLLSGTQAAAVPHARRAAANALRVETFVADSFTKPAPNVITDKFVPIKRKPGSSRGSHYLNTLREQLKKRDGSGDAPVYSAAGGIEYLMQINFQGTDVQVIVDTGSSDTWLAESDLQCLDSSGNSVAQSQCNFGALYPGSFANNSLGQLQISYGDGEYANGNFGKADITIAGIKVPQVESALVNQAYWNGDGISSGLLGLGYPGLTSDFVNGNRVAYNPIFTTMYEDGLSSAMFSMALERGSAGGYIAFGGLPPVNYDANSWGTTPIKKTVIFSGNEPQYGFYTMTPDAIVYQGSAASQTEDWIVDSGTTLMLAPPDVASAINALFVPPSTDGQTVSCNATAPDVAVKIGGKSYTINAADMILSQPGGSCISGIQGGSAPYILGDTFMKNVVVAFDVGAAELRFAAAPY